MYTAYISRELKDCTLKDFKTIRSLAHEAFVDFLDQFFCDDFEANFDDVCQILTNSDFEEDQLKFLKDGVALDVLNSFVDEFLNEFPSEDSASQYDDPDLCEVLYV